MIETLTEETLYKKSPQELTRILYYVILERLQLAKEAIQERRFDQANHHLQKCNDLLYRLGVGLNYDAGIIADQLEAIYQYLADTTIQANVKKDVLLIENMIAIVRDLADAWEQALGNRTESLQFVHATKAKVYDNDYSPSYVDNRE